MKVASEILDGLESFLLICAHDRSLEALYAGPRIRKHDESSSEKELNILDEGD